MTITRERYDSSEVQVLFVIIVALAIDIADGVLLFFFRFRCVEEKSDSDRRDSNPGPERS